jgi:alpha-tubulin suppressor-like RCC1 family protein
VLLLPLIVANCFTTQAQERWAALSLGTDHSAGVSCDGRLYTWGINSSGQLGSGDQSDALALPTLLTTLQNTEVR